MPLKYRDSAEYMPCLFVEAFGSVVTRARVLVHEAARAKMLAERRLRITAPITPGPRSKRTARGAFMPSEVSW
jgi:hypothetical protein